MPSETKQQTVVRSEKGRWAARAACVVGLLYAAVSLYWAAGGKWLLNTVGGSFARPGPANDATVIIAVWAAAVLKLAAALLPLLALRNPRRQPRVACLLAWIAAGTLIIYGAVLSDHRPSRPGRCRPQPGQHRLAGIDLACLPLGPVVPGLGSPDRNRTAPQPDRHSAPSDARPRYVQSVRKRATGPAARWWRRQRQHGHHHEAS